MSGQMRVTLNHVLTIASLVIFGRVSCDAEYHRPMRRELQSNKTVYMHCCVAKGVCKEYIHANGLGHFDCHSLCELSWKWAHAEAGADPSITLPPDDTDMNVPELDDYGDGVTARKKPRSPVNYMKAIGDNKLSHSEGHVEQRERQSQKRKHIGGGHRGAGDQANIIKSMEQKIVEIKAASESHQSSGKSGKHDKSDHKEESDDSGGDATEEISSQSESKDED